MENNFRHMHNTSHGRKAIQTNKKESNIIDEVMK